MNAESEPTYAEKMRVPPWGPAVWLAFYPSLLFTCSGLLCLTFNLLFISSLLCFYNFLIVVVFVFKVPPTAKVIWRRGHGLKSRPTDW